MICLRPGRARRALDRIQPRHLFRIRIAALGEIARIARHSRESCREKIRIERNDDIRFREVVNRLHGLPESHSRAFINVVAIHWFPEMPLGFRKRLLELLHLVGESRRRKRLREDPDS